MRNKNINLDSTEVKNGESIASLQQMVLGMVSYRSSEMTPGKYLALDCEMVGVGPKGSESSLARVSVVNFHGAVVFNSFVRQRERVVDYRTQWSGVRKADLEKGAKPFDEVQSTVASFIKDQTLIGHAVHNDLKALLLSHPSSQLCDTQALAYKCDLTKSRRIALRTLVRQELGVGIQDGEHDSITDARAAMAVFRLYKREWESGFRSRQKKPKPKSKSKSKPASASGSKWTVTSDWDVVPAEEFEDFNFMDDPLYVSPLDWLI